MKKTLHWLAVSTACFLGGIGGTAHATSTVSASLTDFTVNAIGSFAWLHAPTAASPFETFMTADSADQIGWVDDGTFLYPDFSPHQHADARPDAFVTASVQTTGTVSTAQAHSTATSLHATVTTNADGGHAGASARWSDSFVLGAGASVTFSWTQGVAAFNPGGDVLPQRYLDGPNDTPDVGLTLIEVFAGNQNLTTARNGFSGIGDADIGYAFSDLGQTRSLTVTNWRATDYTGSFYAYVSAEASDLPSAVPEAHTLPLAGVGVALVLLLKRRRALSRP